MARFRLRFLLQEFDLAPGETVIGRSPECHITIEDPLISRQHARIVVASGVATFYDLGSRNGSRVNARMVTEPLLLADGDRIRLGTQELVFLKVRSDQRMARATGAMRLCLRCKTPFPEGPANCPHCGHVVQAEGEDETVAGIAGMSTQRGWVLQMLNDVLEKAVRSGKVGDVEKVLYRAAEETENRFAQGEIDVTQFTRTADFALQYASLQKDARWVAWVLDMHRRVAKVPQPTTIDLLQSARSIEGVREALQDYLRALAESGAALSDADTERRGRLEALVRADASPANGA